MRVSRVLLGTDKPRLRWVEKIDKLVTEERRLNGNVSSQRGAQMRGLGTVLVALSLSVGLQAAWQIRMQVTLPNGGTPQLVVKDGGMAALQIDNVGRFGFEATVDPANRDAVRVTVYDLAGRERTKMEDVVLPAGGGAVSTQTTPSFGLSIVNVRDVQF